MVQRTRTNSASQVQKTVSTQPAVHRQSGLTSISTRTRPARSSSVIRRHGSERSGITPRSHQGRVGRKHTHNNQKHTDDMRDEDSISTRASTASTRADSMDSNETEYDSTPKSSGSCVAGGQHAFNAFQ